ncbi:MAG: twin-arginine translocase subunit TatC [Thermoplasmata archaeon]
MSFFEHLEELRQRLKIVIAAFIIVFAIILTFAIQPVPVGNTTIYLPVPTADQGRTIPAQLIILLNHSLVQGSASIAVFTPAEAVMAQLKVAMFLAAVITSPLTTYEFWRFVAPALKANERRLILRITVPIVALFLSGVLVSLLVVLPFTFPFLYGFAAAFGATPLLQLDEFLDFVLWFSLAFGLAFELPVVMYGLSYLGIVSPDFWKKNWRYAAIAIFIFGAVITPDGSGVTMMLVSIPMLFLYVMGYVAVVRRTKHLAAKGLSPPKSS